VSNGRLMKVGSRGLPGNIVCQHLTSLATHLLVGALRSFPTVQTSKRKRIRIQGLVPSNMFWPPFRTMWSSDHC